MEIQRDISGMLDLISAPAFYVNNSTVVRVNSAAQGLLLTPGTAIDQLLVTGKEEYAAFSGGCLYLVLNCSGMHIGASVRRLEDTDVFILEQEPKSSELTALALAARELREPMSGIMLSSEHIFSQVDEAEAARLNRGLHQILRILGNMAEAESFCSGFHEETIPIGSVFAEIFEKAQLQLAHAGLTLNYSGLEEPIYCLGDSRQLERAVMNLLSNAAKFTSAGGTIDASLCRRGRMLQLSIRDSGSGIPDSILPTVFHRYLRQPALEDGRFGIGLGMLLVRTAARNHGGTVLIDQPDGNGTRVTMTMAIRQNTGNVLRTPRIRTDYSGERDHILLELAECLPAELYKPNNQ